MIMWQEVREGLDFGLSLEDQYLNQFLMKNRDQDLNVQKLLSGLKLKIKRNREQYHNTWTNIQNSENVGTKIQKNKNKNYKDRYRNQVEQWK